jgi:hypothetical protein
MPLAKGGGLHSGAEGLAERNLMAFDETPERRLGIFKDQKRLAISVQLGGWLSAES